MTLSLGLGLPQMKQYEPSRDVTAVARDAEECGFDSLWVFERTWCRQASTRRYWTFRRGRATPVN